MADVSPDELAELIVKATPAEFAAIWLGVAQKLKTFTYPNTYKTKVREWGEAMGEPVGSTRLELLELIVDTARHKYNGVMRFKD